MGISRNSWNSDQVKTLSRFYHGKRCVFLGEENTSVDWHHLDGNSANTVVLNGVPISSNQNATEGRSRNSLEARALMDIEQIKSRVVAHFNGADYALGYGLSRFAAFFTWPIELLENAQSDTRVAWAEYSLGFARDAINNARALNRTDLIADILERNVDVILNAVVQLPATIRAMIALEIGCVYWDYGEGQRFSIWSNLVSRILESTVSTGNDRITRARKDWKDLAWDVASGQSNKNQIEELYEESHPSISRVGPPNVRLWAARRLLKEGRFDQASNILGPYAEIEDSMRAGKPLRGISWWTALELRLTQIEIAVLRDPSADFHAEIDAISRKFEDLEVVPSSMDNLSSVLTRYSSRPMKVRVLGDLFRRWPIDLKDSDVPSFDGVANRIMKKLY